MSHDIINSESHTLKLYAEMVSQMCLPFTYNETNIQWLCKERVMIINIPKNGENMAITVP